MNNINSEVYADISIIISMMPIEMRNKISNSFINFIENNKSNNYVSNINPQKPIKEQNIRKEMLGIIYRDYLCSYEERKKLIEEEQKEIIQIEEKFRQKYNPDDIFKNKKKINEKNIQSVDEKRMVVIEEKWYKKVWKFLTKFFIKSI